MPFLDAAGRELRTLELRQLLDDDGLHGRIFQLREPFAWRDEAGGTVVEPHDLTRPARAEVRGRVRTVNGTDIASVPSVFWAFIAPYGRQSPPAVLHDRRVDAIERQPVERWVALRRPVDLEFQRALRDRRVPRLRARLMWAFVSLQSYFEPAPSTAGAIIGGAALASLAAWAAVVLGVAVSPWWWLLLAAPVLAVLSAWRIRRLMLTLVLTGLFLGPLMLAQVVLVGLFRLVEIAASPFDDRGGSVFTPTLDRNRLS